MKNIFKKLSAIVLGASMLLQFGALSLTASAASGVIKNKMTFEDITEGTSASNIAGIVVNNGTASIERDELGSKAVKITSPAQVRFKISATDKKYTELEFKVRSVKHKYEQQYEFGAVFRGEKRIVKSFIYKNNMMTFYTAGSTTDNSATASLLPSESYITIKYIIDNQAKSFTVYKDGKQVSHYGGTGYQYYDTSSGSPDTLIFNPQQSDSEYYIDDIIWSNADTLDKTFYVDVVNGSSDGDGTKEKPFKTISQAKEYIKERNASFRGDLYVKIGGGEYCEVLKFTADDKLVNGGITYYQAAENEVPVISGGTEISGWTLHDSEKGIYKAKITDVDNFRQLYIDGRRAVRAKSTDSMGIKGYNETLCVTDNTDIAGWNNINDVEVNFAAMWTHPILTVTSASVEDGKTYLKLNQTGYNAVNKDNLSTAIYSAGIQREAWYVENAYELLDECGEWYFDESAKILYYKPMAYEDMNSVKAVVPKEETLLSVSGTADDKAGNIVFDGLQFKYTTWLKPSTDGFYIGAQNNIDNSANLDRHGVIYSGAVEMKYADKVDFANCVVSSAGSNGIVMRTGVQNVSIKYCNIFDIAGGGIYVGPVRFVSANINPTEADALKNILISDNIIHNTGEDYKSASAVSAGYPIDTTFTHNEIYNTSFDGFHIGYGWNKPAEGQTGGAGITVSNNYLHDIMTSELYDGGAIYTLGGNGATAENPNIISGNYIKNMYNQYGALYNDEGSNNWQITNNVFDNTQAEEQTGKTIRWLHWHTSSISDCVAKNNYSTTDAVYNNTGGNSTWSDLTVFDPSEPFEAVTEIIKNSGVREQASEPLSLSGEYKNNSFVMSINGAFSEKESQTACGYAAVYKDGALIRIKRVNIRLNNGVRMGDKIEVSGLAAGNYTGKVFLWTAGGMEPFANKAECTFAAEE